MKNSKIAYYVLFLFFVIPTFLTCQEAYQTMPASFSEDNMQQLEPVILHAVDVSEISETKESMLPLSAGYTILLNTIDLKPIIWEEAKDGSYICRLRYDVAGALALNVYFQHLDLHVDDQLFIYNANASQITGAFTARNNAEQFAIGFLEGDQIIIELNTKTKYENLPFLIREIGVATELSKNIDRDYGDSGSCEVLVNCSEGDNWQYEKDGVARVLVKEGSKLFWCTGSLLNNTRNDGTPYFLTANHCGKNATTYDYGGWIFYFNYEVEDCEAPIFEPDFGNNLIGAQLLAHSEFDVDLDSDFKLLLLNEEVPDDFRVFYNGWDRSSAVSPSGVTMHHPQGDVKMISTYDEPLVSVDYYNTTPNEDGSFWMVTWTGTENGHGVTEGGSSGCPIFSSEGYLIGTLTGGDASCARPNEPDYYGKLSYAWESDTDDSTRQLKYWLDPDDSGVLSMKGTNLDSTKVTANFSSDVTEVSIGQSIQFYNYSVGNIIEYEWYFEGGEPAYSEMENPPSIQYNNFGSYTVKLVAKSTFGVDSIIRENYVKVLPNLSPNPSTEGVYKLSFGRETPEDIEVEVYDMNGRKVSPVFLKKKNDGLYVNLSTHPSGIYVIYVKDGGRQQIIKASYINTSY